MLTIADINGDNYVNNADVQYLINLLLSGGGSTSDENTAVPAAAAPASGNGTSSINTASTIVASDTTISPSAAIALAPLQDGSADVGAVTPQVETEIANLGSDDPHPFPKHFVFDDLNPTVMHPVADRLASSGLVPLPISAELVDGFYELLDPRNPPSNAAAISGFNDAPVHHARVQPSSKCSVDTRDLIEVLLANDDTVMNLAD